MKTPKIQSDFYGLDHWMEQAAKGIRRARKRLSPEAVHDLRVPLRRCRTILSALAAERKSSVFEKIKRYARIVFRKLGDLRDIQVLETWNKNFESYELPCCERAAKLLKKYERRAGKKAGKSIRRFSVKKWQELKKIARAEISSNPPSPKFLKNFIRTKKEIFLKRHFMAEKEKTGKAYHRLRVGLKKFRYAMENSPSEKNKKCGAKLARLQDSLGEFHDLCLLEKFLESHGNYFSRRDLNLWKKILRKEQLERIRHYRRLIKNEFPSIFGPRKNR